MVASESADPLQVLQARTAAAVGADYFQALASAFAEAFGMRYGLLARVPRARLDVMETLALWTGQGFAPTEVMDLATSPCLESVARRVARQLGSGVMREYPGHAFFVEHAIESYICVPVIGRSGEVVGVLSACDPGCHAEIEGFAEWVKPFTDRAAWLIERLDLEEKLRREADRAEGLATIAAIFQRTDMSCGSFDDVCAVVRGVLDVDCVALRILDAEGRDLVLRGGAGLPAVWSGIVRVPLKMIERQVPEEDAVIYLDRERMAATPGASRVISEALQSGVLTKARHEGRLIGLLTAFSSVAGRRWQPDDTRWLVGVAGLVAQAFVNTRLVEALRASETNFRSIVTTALEGVITLDGAHRVTFANPQAGEMFGCSADALVGRAALELVAPSHHEVAAERLEALRRGLRQRFEVLLACPDGQERWAVLSTTPTPDARSPGFGATVLLADVTEMRGLADRVAHLRKLESLGVLAGGIAHDFNNILLAILGNLDLAREQLPASSPVQVFLDEIGSAGQRAAELTRQILTFAGRSLPRVRRLELGRLVTEMRGELRRSVAGNHALELSVAAEVYVDADAGQLRQMLGNIVLNASEAMGERAGVIRVEVAQRTGEPPADMDASSPSPGSYAVLVVRDEGHGIDPTIRPRIFDPFFSTKFTGRGLGLSTALGIVRSHRGSITVDSSLGVGSTFTMTFPLASGPRTPPPRLVPVARKVLVVDDDPTVLSVSCHVLERAGYAVVRASDGAVAVSHFVADREGFSAVLLDITMPGIGGIESLRALRRIRGDVPIVLTSGYEEHDVLRGLEADMPFGFIQKPWTADALVRAIGAAIEG